MIFLAGGGVDSDSAMKLNTQKAGKKKEAQNCKLCADSAAHIALGMSVDASCKHECKCFEQVTVCSTVITVATNL